eukprot:1457535-Amphidinium_carterae.1
MSSSFSNPSRTKIAGGRRRTSCSTGIFTVKKAVEMSTVVQVVFSPAHVDNIHRSKAASKLFVL